MDLEFTSKMQNILCSLHHKKIQLMCIAPGCRHFFVCTECLSREKHHSMEHLEHFVSIDDFKQNFLRKMNTELNQMAESVNWQKNHIQNHVDNTLITIEADFQKIEKTLVNYVKQQVTIHKKTVLNKFQDQNRINMKALDEISAQLDFMLHSS